MTYPQPVQIEHAVTSDDEIGAMPPIDAGVWCAVRSINGATTWRRIHLSNTPRDWQAAVGRAGSSSRRPDLKGNSNGHTR